MLATVRIIRSLMFAVVARTSSSQRPRKTDRETSFSIYRGSAAWKPYQAKNSRKKGLAITDAESFFFGAEHEAKGGYIAPLRSRNSFSLECALFDIELDCTPKLKRSTPSEISSKLAEHCCAAAVSCGAFMLPLYMAAPMKIAYRLPEYV